MARWVSIVLPIVLTVVVTLVGWAFSMSRSASAEQEKTVKLEECCKDNRNALKEFNRSIGSIDATLKNLDQTTTKIDGRIYNLEQAHMEKRK